MFVLWGVMVKLTNSYSKKNLKKNFTDSQIDRMFAIYRSLATKINIFLHEIKNIAAIPKLNYSINTFYL